MSSALATDLYELTMAVSYLRRGMTQPATFSLFARRLPPQRGYLVAAGLASCLDHLASVRFTDDELAYCHEVLGFGTGDVEALASLRFTGDVWAVPEGRVVLADEPLLEVTAPLPEAQLVETALLNFVTFQTAVATKAARCRLAAPGATLVDFGLRRTQGLEAGRHAARASALVGFEATSNVAAARELGLVASGTMAHSYVEAFPTEREAFTAFAEDFPARSTFLVDTYDTLQGVRTAVDVIRSYGGPGPFAVRLDSGDLGELAAAARALLDAAGLPGVRILASGGLDEHAVDALVRAGAPIDAYGIGTKMGVSADAPSLDTAYKLVEHAGRPVAKTSPGKATLPGRKQVFRGPGCDDMIALRDEAVPRDAEPLLEPVLVAGQPVGPHPSLASGTARFRADVAALPAAALALADPVTPVARHSEALDALASRTWARAG